MAPRGPAPKPAHLRQRANKKSTHATIEALPADSEIPTIPNPDGREWHALTLQAWEHAWRSPMASQWLETDRDALGRLALLWDQFYNRPGAGVMAEIRLQEQRYGLSPLDRSRLQWEVNRGDEAERERQRRTHPPTMSVGDPRKLLKAVK